MKYEKPAVQRFGSLRELTLGGGAQLSGDATNLYHRSYVAVRSTKTTSGRRRPEVFFFSRVRGWASVRVRNDLG